MEDKYYDIARLKKVSALCEKIIGLMYHMDDKEYSRMKNYIDSRFDISFPYSNPTTKKETPNT